jgi:hypothetical protein
MLESYFQNMSVSMTKEAYFEMCDALGTEPIEEEIPVEMQDFPDEVQEAISIYYKLRDDWDTMNGVYMGKSYVGLMDILDIMEVDSKDRKYLLDWISVMDAARSKMISAQQKHNKSTQK